MLNKYSVARIWTRVCPDVAQCVLCVRDAADQSTFVDYQLQHARQEPLSRVDTALGGNLVEDETAPWLIWQDDLDAASAPIPKKGDEIRRTLPYSETVAVWEITAVDAELFGQPYVCRALRQGIAAES